MADEAVLRKKCDVSGCPTPYDAVKRLTIEMDGWITRTDLCSPDRDVPRTVKELIGLAYDREKIGIRVTDPKDVRRRGRT